MTSFDNIFNIFRRVQEKLRKSKLSVRKNNIYNKMLEDYIGMTTSLNFLTETLIINTFFLSRRAILLPFLYCLYLKTKKVLSKL